MQKIIFIILSCLVIFSKSHYLFGLSENPYDLKRTNEKKEVYTGENILSFEDNSLLPVSGHFGIVEGAAFADLDLKGADSTPLIQHEQLSTIKSCGDFDHKEGRCSYEFRENHAQFSTFASHQLEKNDVDLFRVSFNESIVNYPLSFTQVPPILAVVPLFPSSWLYLNRRINYIVVGPKDYLNFSSTVGTTVKHPSQCNFPSHVIIGNSYDDVVNNKSANVIVLPNEKIITCTTYLTQPKFWWNRKIMWDLKFNWYVPDPEGIVYLPIRNYTRDNFRIYSYEENGNSLVLSENIGSILGEGWPDFLDSEKYYAAGTQPASLNGILWDQLTHTLSRPDSQPTGFANRFCPIVAMHEIKTLDYDILFPEEYSYQEFKSKSQSFGCLVETCYNQYKDDIDPQNIPVGNPTYDTDCCFAPCV